MDKNLKAINWEECIKVTNNPQLAKDLLGMFAKELPLLEKNIEQARKTNNRHELIKILHKLQGSSSYCGITRLKNIAAELEKQLKTNPHLTTNDISDGLEKLFEEIRLIKKELKLFAACES